MNRAVLLLLFLVACPGSRERPDGGLDLVDAGAKAPTVTAEINAAIDAQPKDANGNIMKVGAIDVGLGPVEKGPTYASARCIDLLGACLMGEHRAPMDCARRVQTCATSAPWNEAAPCCPKACVDEAVRREASGLDSTTAYAGVFAAVHPCFPGVVERYCAAGGTPPGGCP